MNSTEQLTDRHLECFGRGDLDGIVGDYSSDASVAETLPTFSGALRQ